MQDHEPIAITGIGCRLPGGANGPEAFWNLLRNGIDGITEIPEDRWNIRSYFDPEPGQPGKTNSRWGGFVDGIDRFDPEFFGISPREAASMDPQQRLLLETAWESLEDAGHVVDAGAGSQAGVFVGISTHDYSQIQASFGDKTSIGAHTTTGSVMSIAANRLSYLFNFHGPSIAVDTACSSSLVAVHLACRSLRNGECTLALACGVNAIVIPDTFIGFSKMSMLSPDGRCKAFDASGNGFVRGEGAGVIVLKPLSVALADGDRIYAVICGSAVNQDGRTSSLTVPGSEAQRLLILEACRDARVKPAEVDYVEAHGTGTAVGDPIEAGALGAALGQGRSGNACLIGSVKTNIGHLEAGSGIAGIIKVALALHHGEVPPNLHFNTPNPEIDFEKLKLRVPVAPEKLPRPDAVAGINSFGFGGTNAHVILQRAAVPSAAPSGPAHPSLFTLSARDGEGLRALAAAHAEWLAATPEELDNICHTLASRRKHHGHRLALTAGSKAEAAEKLQAFLAGESRPGLSSGIASDCPKLAFVFTGQGPQWWAMGREMLAEPGVFREKIKECDALFRQWGDWSLIEELSRDESESRMEQTAIAQPAIFALQVALAAWWRARGIEPGAVIGHSVGEAAAAHLSGALDLASAAKVIFHRGRCMQLVPPTGKMLAVALAPEAVRPYLAGFEGRAEIGAVNSPRSVTLSGQPDALEEIARTLGTENIWCRFLRVNYAFHSAQMDPIESELKAALRGIESAPPSLPIYSTVSGEGSATGKFDADYWWRNVRQPVRFAAGIDAMIGDGFSAFLEVGPHPALSGSVTECLKDRGVTGLTVGSLRRSEPELQTLLGSLGALHVAGVPVRWNGPGRCVALPSYPWKHERFWHEAEQSAETRLGPPIHPLLGCALHTADPVWELKINRELLPYLDDHRVHGSVVFPAAAYVEMALGAGRALHPEPPLILEDLEFQRALFLTESETAPRLQLACNAADGSFRIDARARNSERAWTTHCTGKIRVATNARRAAALVPEEIRTRCAEEISGETSYGLFREFGLDFGPAFRGVNRIWRRDGEALGEIVAPEKVKSAAYLFHPALLDACFQILLAALPDDGSARQLYLPVQVGRVRFFARPEGSLLSHVRLIENNGKSIVADLTLIDADGVVLAEISGFRCAAIEQARTEAEKGSDAFYEICWREREPVQRMPGSVKGDWLILPGDEPLVREISARIQAAGGECETADGLAALAARLSGGRPPGQVVYLPPTGGADAAVSANALCGDLLEIVQKLAAHGDASRLAVVTRGAQPAGSDGGVAGVEQGAIPGLARVAMNEHQELRCRLIDLSPEPSPGEIDALVEELRDDSGEDEIALRDGVCLVPRLVSLDVKPRFARGTEAPFRLEVVKPGVFDQIEFRALPRRAPLAGEIEVEVCAAGLNFRDVMKVLGIYPIEQPSDQLLGDECSGRVTAVGEGVTQFRSGDDALVVAPGCFSKFITVPAVFAVRKPAHFTHEEAATIPVTFLTAHYALHHLARIASGERVLIHAAAGGVGLSAMQIARNAGAEIFATAGSDSKRVLVREMGAAHVMDSRSLDFADEIREITGGRGVDIVLNSLAGEAIPKSLSVLAPYGRFLEIGKRDIYQNSRLGLRPFSRNLSFFAIDLSQLLRDRPAFIGGLLADLMRQFEAHALEPLPNKVYPIAEAADAFREMAQGKHTGKIVFSFGNADVPVRQARVEPVRFRGDATYLVTGGVRGFGLVIAEWMIGQGARNLVLAGASTASAEAAREHFSGAAAHGVRVVTVAADVSDAKSLAGLFAKIRETLPPLRGVVHAAMKMDDGILKQLDPQRFWNVMGPKAGGAWNLHVLTRELPLDFFVLISSISSLVGNPGQGNYSAANAFLDALAHHRRALGLAALAINWGHLGEVGYAARHANVSEHLARYGVAAIPVREALEMLGQLLQSDVAQAAAMRMDWKRWAEANPRVKKLPRYGEVVSFEAAAEQTAGGGDAAAAILRAPAGERQKLLEAFIQEQAARVLGTSPTKLDPARPLNELGLDSLMGIELVNRIEAGLGFPFPTEKLMGGPSITLLASILNAALPGSAETPEAAPKEEAPEKIGEAAAQPSSEQEPKGMMSRLRGAMGGRK